MEKLELNQEYLPKLLPYWVIMSTKDGKCLTLLSTYLLLKIQRGEIHNLFPRLKPLSDLDKVLDQGGMTWLDAMPDDNLLNWCDAYDIFFNSIDIYEYLSWKQAPYELTDWMLKNHFDVFGLIEKGLAIDINTLK